MALTHASPGQAAVARDYRQALNAALDALIARRTASADTVDRKAAAKTEADRALHNAAPAIVDARARLRAAETSRRASRPAGPSLRRDVADAEKDVQEARTAFDGGNHLDAIDSIGRQCCGWLTRVRWCDAASDPTPPLA